MLVINGPFYLNYMLGKESPMMPKENKLSNEFENFSLCIRKRVLLGGCIPNIITLHRCIIKDL